MVKYNSSDNIIQVDDSIKKAQLSGKFLYEIDMQGSDKENVFLELLCPKNVKFILGASQNEEKLIFEVPNVALLYVGEIFAQLVFRDKNNDIIKKSLMTEIPIITIEKSINADKLYESEEYKSLYAKLLEMYDNLSFIQNDLEEKIETDYYRGAKGDKGDKGEKGDKGDNLQIEFLENAVLSLNKDMVDLEKRVNQFCIDTIAQFGENSDEIVQKMLEFSEYYKQNLDIYENLVSRINDVVKENGKCLKFGEITTTISSFYNKKGYNSLVDNVFQGADNIFNVTATLHNKVVDGVSYPITLSEDIQEEYRWTDSPIVKTLENNEILKLFDANHETSVTIPENCYLKVKIKAFNNTRLYNYPYGNYYIFYYNRKTYGRASEVRYYNNYEPHQKGWKHLVFDRLNDNYLLTVAEKVYDWQNFGMNDLEFIIFGEDNNSVLVNSIEFYLDRAKIMDTSYISKALDTDLYANYRVYHNNKNVISFGGKYGLKKNGSNVLNIDELYPIGSIILTKNNEINNDFNGEWSILKQDGEIYYWQRNS